MNSIEQPLLTPAQVAKCLQINEHTVLDWLRDGYLRGYKLGKAWRISPEDFEHFLEGRANRTDVAEEAGNNAPTVEAPITAEPATNGGTSLPAVHTENQSTRNGTDDSQSDQDKAPLSQGFFIGQERRGRT